MQLEIQQAELSSNAEYWPGDFLKVGQIVVRENGDALRRTCPLMTQSGHFCQAFRLLVFFCSQHRR